MSILKTAKFLIFVLGICLANYVGGIPKDAKNLFITQTIFFAPYIVDFYPLIKLKSNLKILTILIWGAGILAFVTNIIGVVGVITIHENMVVFSADYFSPFPLKISVNRYLLLVEIVYSIVFMGTITLDYTSAWNKRLLQKKKEKEKGKVSGKELVKHVSTR
jgi:hypothetical protein